jgi:SWI/SNF-related matrix-associated actin-dependent regulator of chromatin subfamily A3
VPLHLSPPSSIGFSSQWDDTDINDADNVSIPESAPLEFYGTMDNKIVGVRYYNGIVTPGESVLCRREPSNAYDSNAVRVDNIMGDQIGHLPRTLVQKVAPYMDKGEIVLEGVLNGHKGPFDCPVRLYFYGTSDPSARLELEAKLKADKLLKATELKNTREEAEAQRAVAKDLANGEPVLGLGSSAYAGSQSRQDVLEDSMAVNFRADPGALDVLNMDEASLSALPEAAQPDTIKSVLLPYQLQVRHRLPWPYQF